MTNLQPPDDDLDRLIRAALAARAGEIVESDLSRQPVSRSPWPWGVPILAGAAVVAIAVATTLVLHSTGDSPNKPINAVTPGPSSSAPSTIPSVSSVPSTSPTSAPSISPSVPSISPSVPLKVPGYVLDYEPLWPSGSWLDAAEPANPGTGRPSWYGDAGKTALEFTRSFLRLSDIGLVTSTRFDDSPADGVQSAHIGVGYRTPAGTVATAAVVHLLAIGNGDLVSWEVVGTDDTTLSLEQPAYGTKVSSPLTVGGHITGVDESIRLAVRSLPGGPVAASTPAGIPAGGQNQPWTGTISFTGQGVMTVVATTGGHLQAVERFAVQGAHT